MNIRKLIREEVRKTLIEGYAGKVLPTQFNHLKWELNRNQKYYLQELCDVDPKSLRESDFKGASNFLGIPEKNVKSIINTYNTYNPMSEGVIELPSDSPLMKGITSADAGMTIDNMNRAPVRANRTTYPNQDHRTQMEKKTMDYAIRKNRIIDRRNNGDSKKTYYENVHTSLMMYLFCEVKPKDINLNHKGQIQIDQEPMLLEGESFNMENSTYRKVNVLLQSFNEIFDTSFRIADHIDLSETTHKCHRTFVEHIGFSDDKMFWNSDGGYWVKPGQNGYEKLKEQYVQMQGQQNSMPSVPRVDHKEMMKKYINGDLISYNPNADWLI